MAEGRADMRGWTRFQTRAHRGGLAVLVAALCGGVGALSAGTHRVPPGPSRSQPIPSGITSSLLEACQGPNPYFAVTRVRVSGHPPAESAALVAVHDTDSADKRWDEEDQVVLARHADVGNVNGVAYDQRRHHVYVAASHKVLTAFGPGGTGAIYQVDLNTGSVAEFARLAAGPDHHSDVFRDRGAGTWVGRTSLGDIDVDDTSSSLFAVNLEDRRIYRFSLEDGHAMGSFAHGAAAEPWAPNARPFGLGFRDGWVFHGVVDSRENPNLPGGLAGYVYRSRADGTDMRQVLRVDLTYGRNVAWRAWADFPESQFPTPAQPTIADIEFRSNGDLILGIGDRARDMGMYGPARGDILHTERVDDARWIVPEGGHSYYADPTTPPQTLHGGLASMPHDDVVVAAGEFSSAAGGLLWYENATGQRHHPVDGKEWIYGDSPPIGDLEALCESGPRRLYLPLVVRGTCPAAAHADVVLVMDASSSMARSTSDGTSKIDAATQAAGTLINLMELADATARIAVVGFNDRSWTEASLGPAADARNALARLKTQMSEGTRLDLALSTTSALIAARGATTDRRATVILLTDGLPNHVPPAEDGTVETTVLRAAANLKSLGVVVHTVGFGEPGDFNAQLLSEIASGADRFHAETSASGLQRLFTILATGVGCP